MYLKHFIFCFIVVCAVEKSNESKILGFFPTMSKSHMELAKVLFDELGNRGHDVILVSPFIQKDNSSLKFKEIEIPNLNSILPEEMFNNTFDYYTNQLAFLMKASKVMEQLVELALNNTNVQNLLHSNMKFDLVIVEVIMNEAHFALGKHFNAPLIGFSTLGSSGITNDLVGNPSPYSYVPFPFLPFSDRMTFFQRVLNTIAETIFELSRFYVISTRQTYFLRKYFPEIKDDIFTIMHNTSLILLNSHLSLAYPKPALPNMIDIGGFHVRKPKPLPEDLQKYLDEATDGAIYFSMGSNLKSKDLSPDKRDAFLNVFKQLKMKVLWKWEDDSMPNQPSNVKISSWFPQRDILAHPNIKLFITHGGLLSTTEAVYHGVPLLAIPIFADQKWNINKAKLMGCAVVLNFNDITTESVFEAISSALNDSSYTDNVKKRSKILKDQPMDPLDLAIYWIEYVIRHNGAPHLQSGAIKLNKFQYLLLDVIPFILCVMCVSMISSYFCLKMTFKKVFLRKSLKTKVKTQ